jgi:signal transduction histidine kinase
MDTPADTHDQMVAKTTLETQRDDLEALVAERTRALRDSMAASALEQARQEAERASRAKNEFLENMSHELRTPLNAIIGFASVMRRNRAQNLNSSDIAYLDRIHANGVALLRIIDDLLDVSKLESGTMEISMGTVRLDEMIRDLAAQCASHTRPGVRMIAELPAHAVYLRADALRLRQVLLNQISNAIKFTEAGSVTAAVICGDNGDPVRIEVRDTGVGIPPDRVAKIFDSFEQADSGTGKLYGGTGLGLAISRALCEQMGFTLTMTSAVGEGSTFTVGLSGTSER